MRAVRWSAVLVLATVFAGTAAASDDAANGLPQPIPQEQWEAPLSPQNESPSGDSASREQPRPVLDRRDRIFYPGDTERLKPLGRKLLLNFLLDQKEIFTSPFQMNRHNAPIWLLSAGAIRGLIASDHRLANSFENNPGQGRSGGRGF